MEYQKASQGDHRSGAGGVLRDGGRGGRRVHQSGSRRTPGCDGAHLQAKWRLQAPKPLDPGTSRRSQGNLRSFSKQPQFPAPRPGVGEPAPSPLSPHPACAAADGFNNVAGK